MPGAQLLICMDTLQAIKKCELFIQMLLVIITMNMVVGRSAY